MTEKEIAEIRRRYKSDKCGIAKIKGCYVGADGNVITEFTVPIATMLEDETNELLSVMKKTLSGTLGKNLLDIEFRNDQVLNGTEHKALMELRNSSLDDENAVHDLYNKIINSYRSESGYLILLANDKYDVFSYTSDGKKEEDSSALFSYILCCVCPVKLTKTAVSFQLNENTFRNIAANSIVAPPELGFMFPAFDDRAANIYNALFYTKNISLNYADLIDSIFKCDIPMPATEQRETFCNIIADTIPENRKLDVIKAVQDEVCFLIEEQKVNKDPEPVRVSKDKLKSVIKNCGATDEELSVFEEKYNQSFGEKTKLYPKNIVDTNQFNLQTPDVTIKVNPERSDLVKTKIIDGSKYILIRADENVEVNGININISE